jgi:hypothetical protein
MDGRVLTEALKESAPNVKISPPQRLEAKAPGWHQYLNVSAVNGVEYLDEGNGEQQK